MKYIAKKIQKYLNESQKEEYKKILKLRNTYIKNNPLKSVKLYSNWSKKSWWDIPSPRNCYYIVDPKEKEQYKIHRIRIRKLDEKIKKLEMLAFERKEREICKAGSLLVHSSKWSRTAGKKYLVQEKESRDYYTLVDISNMRIFSTKWIEIVRYYELDEVSK
tara:strand:+ start:152 stop:637 length:486 start_codon:yes stop_codon:yes gene_type:complete